MKELLSHRKALKRRKPVFLKQDTHKKPGIAKKWSRPRGIDSKMRLKLKGYRRMVSVGWKSPAAVRGLHQSGVKGIVVSNEACLRKAGKSDGLIISSAVGQKKRIKLLRIAQELGLAVLNVKDPAKFIAEAEKGMADKKKLREAKKTDKRPDKKKEEAPQKQEAASEKDDAAKDKEAVGSSEEKREKQVKEQEKLLIKRE